MKLSDLRYTNPEQTCIEMTVEIDGFYIEGPFPFHYMPGDRAPVTLAVADLLASGAYDIAPYVATTPPAKPAAPPSTGKSSVIAD